MTFAGDETFLRNKRIGVETEVPEITNLGELEENEKLWRLVD